MSRPRKKTRKRWTRQGVDGHVKPRDGRAWMFYSKKRRTTGLQWDPTNKEHALDMLQEWVRSEKAARLGLRTGPEVQRSVGELIAKYHEMRLRGAAADNIKNCAAAFDFLLGPVFDRSLSLVEPLTLAIDSALQAKSKRTGKPLAPSTQDRYLRSVRTLFTFGVKLGWITRNPTALIEPMPNHSEGHVAVPWEIATDALTEVYKRNAVVAECLELILMTGMRQHEARGLRRYQLHDDHIDVRGKGAGRLPGESHEDWWARKPRRIVPIHRDAKEWKESGIRDWQLRLASVVDRALKRTPNDPKAHLFPSPKIVGKSISEDTLIDGFRAGLKVIGASQHYTVHGLRKTTEYWYEATLNFDPFTFCDLTGHDIGTYVKAYRQRRTAGDLAKAIALAAGVTDYDPNRTKPPVVIDRTHPHTSS